MSTLFFPPSPSLILFSTHSIFCPHPHPHILLNHLEILATFMVLYPFTSTPYFSMSLKSRTFFFKTTISLIHSRVKMYSTLSFNKVQFLNFPSCLQMTFYRVSLNKGVNQGSQSSLMTVLSLWPPLIQNSPCFHLIT